LPTMIAMGSNHKKTGPILVVNFFLGWTLVGWVVALAWSIDSASHQDEGQPSQHPPFGAASVHSPARHQGEGQQNYPTTPSSNRQEETMDDSKFGRHAALYGQLRKFLKEDLGTDVREFTGAKSRNTFVVDFGGTFDPSRGEAQNGFVQIRPRPDHLMLWVRIEPKLAQRITKLPIHNRSGPDGGHFPLEVHIDNAADLEKAKPLLHQAYARKKAEGHNNQPKI